ncbi:hypothetical protein MLD38_015935 [Melastoma candidum]|uniref:Uncharacterized protein n=1 Tax=Melastoma candidum TaxID=119954 RepID=A0ACB9RR89_9MYRT|nr:hypothetical protein MLD38_015935 [Melastoma candidum]
MGTPDHSHYQMLVGHSPPQGNAESFTALLELPPSNAMDLLLPPTSVEYLVKDEVCPGTDSLNPNLSQSQHPVAGAGRKRKEADQKGNSAGKKKEKKSDSSQDGQILPYVHVRARRGQATDSHSLAERARREKINARMKFLQDLVPGCSKISGTTLVLDEIINHVQSLQQQVEVLSMKLAAVNSWIDFDVDNLIYSRLGATMDGNFGNMVMPTAGFQLDGSTEPEYLHPGSFALELQLLCKLRSSGSRVTKMDGPLIRSNQH